MNRIDRKFRELKGDGKKALSIFLTAGFPSMQATEKLVAELPASGVDLFEIGFPFSDPIADGPLIQKSSEESLKKGMTWKRMLESVRRIRRKTQVPLILMTYANALYCRGWEQSIREMARAGFDGAIIPDVIPEEGKALEGLFRKSGLRLTYLVSPTSSDHRIQMISRRSSGFIYCVSVTGVTGARSALPVSEIRQFLRSVRRSSKVPVLLGFGISKPGHLQAFKRSADGFIIGSAFIKLLDENRALPSLIQKAKRFISPFTLQSR